MNPRQRHGSDLSDQYEKIMKRLTNMASGVLCDSDKLHRQLSLTSDDPDLKAYKVSPYSC